MLASWILLVQDLVRIWLRSAQTPPSFNVVMECDWRREVCAVTRGVRPHAR